MTNASMADACFTARATTKQHVLDRIKNLTLHKNEHGPYTHDAGKGINPSDPGNSMTKLLEDGVNLLTYPLTLHLLT